MKKILITGGAGFIGSHLAKKLLDQGNEVIAVDNLFTGNKGNIYELEKNPKFTFMLHDITQPLWVQVDEIYNLACPASPIHYQRNPAETIKTSFLGTLHMVELALKTKAKLLHASTSEVYGDPLEHPQKESYWGNLNPIGKRSCYDEGKRASETLCADYQREYKVDVRIARIFNTYGPNMHPQDGRVISNFIMQALNNEDITIYGDGSQSRSFQYVSDLVNALIKLMELDNGDCLGPFNLGNPEEYSIYQLANRIIEMVPNTKSKIVYKDLPDDDPKRRSPDITKAKKALNWYPQVELRDGLKETIKYFREDVC
ncbi:MAG: UDP-glucuronic acid decarboxylase family protein [Nanoarchaeota archaeon]